ncbi:MAG: hypothetical protein AB7G35_21475 [Hyphomicrobiaceae bacterium]
MENTFHQDVWAMEQASAREDRAWIRFIDQVCMRIGVSDLDGDEIVDGYSLDSAYAAFRGGISAEDYASGIRPTATMIGG